MEEKDNKSQFIRYMSNPRAFTLRKWLFEILKGNYPAHDGIVERLGTAIATQKDLDDFGKLIGQIYETAYRRAIDDYKHQVEELGLKVNIVPKPLN